MSCMHGQIEKGASVPIKWGLRKPRKPQTAMRRDDQLDRFPAVLWPCVANLHAFYSPRRLSCVTCSLYAKLRAYA
jgi:hypothetical protein